VTTPRRFEKSLPDLPAVAVPDWELLSRLEDLFRPYVPSVTTGGYWLFTARDSRGEYNARTIDELRQEVERQEEPPSEVRVYVDSGSPHLVGTWYELGVTAGSDASRGLLYSTDERIVNHIATRLRELFVQAQRRGEARQGRPRRNGELAKLDTAGYVADPSFWMRHVTALAVGTLSTVVGGVILYLIFGH
jgi:hypothetical protein